jgi:hypothetical protein
LSISCGVAKVLFSGRMIELTLTSVAACYCLLGYWLAFGKALWLWRAGALGVALALLIPIRAYEPLVFFAITSCFFLLAAGCRDLFRMWRSRPISGTDGASSRTEDIVPRRFQFQIYDVLGLMAVLGAMIGITRIILQEQVLLPWRETIVSALAAVAITLATIGVLRGPQRILSGVVLLMAVGCSCGYFTWYHKSSTWRGGYVIYLLLGNQLYEHITSLGLSLFQALLEFIFFVAMLFVVASLLQAKETRPWRRAWKVATIPCLAWLVAMVEAMEDSRDNEQIPRDQLWRSLNERWSFRLVQVLESGMDGSGERDYQRYLLFSKRSICMVRLLMIDLALRDYHADHGKYPESLESLAPAYLREAPLDPFSGKPFVYRPDETEFTLYGVGGDEKDNGGNFRGRYLTIPPWEGWDLCLDAPFD